MRCTNVACPGAALERLGHWASRGAADIDGMGDGDHHPARRDGRCFTTSPTSTRSPPSSSPRSTWGASSRTARRSCSARRWPRSSSRASRPARRAALAAAVRARHPARGRDRGRGARRRVRLDRRDRGRRAHRAAAAGRRGCRSPPRSQPTRSRASRASGPRSPRASARSSTTPTTSRCSAGSVRRASSLAEERREPLRPQTLAGLTFVLTGALDALHAR